MTYFAQVSTHIQNYATRIQGVLLQLINKLLIQFCEVYLLKGARLFKFGQFKFLKKIETAKNKKVMYICQL